MHVGPTLPWVPVMTKPSIALGLGHLNYSTGSHTIPVSLDIAGCLAAAHANHFHNFQHHVCGAEASLALGSADQVAHTAGVGHATLSSHSGGSGLGSSGAHCGALLAHGLAHVVPLGGQADAHGLDKLADHAINESVPNCVHFVFLCVLLRYVCIIRANALSVKPAWA